MFTFLMVLFLMGLLCLFYYVMVVSVIERDKEGLLPVTILIVILQTGLIFVINMSIATSTEHMMISLIKALK